MKHIIILLVAISCCSLVSCDKILDVNAPRNQITSAFLFTSDVTATAAVAGIYSRMSNSGSMAGGTNSIGYMGGLSADEFDSYSPSSEVAQFAVNSLNANNYAIKSFWGELYQYIYSANAVIEGLLTANGVSDNAKTQLSAEAKFIRALCYFYLVNFFGNVPLTTGTDFQVNSRLARNDEQEVYLQIVSDLKEAIASLKEDYPNGKRTRPNVFAARALLARVYLYSGDWVNAEIESTVLINNTMFQLVQSLDEIFLAGSSEAIWQLFPVRIGYNTNDGSDYILLSTPSNIALSASFVYGFEPGDARKEHWVDSISVGMSTYYFPFKYKIKTGEDKIEYVIVFRLAEQYLIRAEARIQKGNIEEGIQDINIIRKRARGIGAGDLPDLESSLSKTEALLKLENERRAELFAEWGHRWLDLKRTGRANDVISAIKPDNWQLTDTIYPIPFSELLNNTKLQQNKGY